MRSRLLLAALPLLASLAAGAHVLGCGSSPDGEAPPCTPAPSSCPAGQSCWAVDAVPHFSCLPSLEGAGLGSACQATLGAVTCGSGLVCDVSVGDANGGKCTAYCDNANPCSATHECHATHAGSPNGPTLQICRAATPPPAGQQATTEDPAGIDGGVARGRPPKTDAGVTPE